MILIININKPTYEYPRTCDWSKNPYKRLKFLMWNGLSRIKIYNNHIILRKIKLYRYIYISIKKFSMHFTNKFFIWWLQIILTLFWQMLSFQKSIMSP
jgi:hypothetical protein